MAMISYWQGPVQVETAVMRISQIIEQFPSLIKRIPETELLHISQPGRWSRKQIIGHLIDSGLNNLKRFTEIQFLAQPYQLQSYSQDELVAVNHYQDIPIDHLLELWQGINKQIVYVIQGMPEEKHGYTVQLNDHERTSLGWLICDYTAHMDHHLKQLMAGAI